MKQLPRCIALLAIALTLAMPITAQSPVITIQLDTATFPAGHSCGALNGSWYCYGIPVVGTVNGSPYNGTLWTDDYGAQFGTKGFVSWNGVPLAQASVDSVTDVRTPMVNRTFTGTLTEQISGPGYTGTLTINYSSYYSRGGGGRACGGCGQKWVALPTSTLLITFN